MKNFKLALLASVVAASVSGVAVAADGALGATSQADSIVTVVKRNAVRITGVDDIDFGNKDIFTANETVGDDVCVYSTTGNYSVTATSAKGTGGAFAMEGAGVTPDTLSYSVTWNNSITPGAGAPLASGTVFNTPAGSGSTDVTTDFNCGGTGANARFEVTVTQADFNAVAIDSYEDTLTLLVAPL